MRLDFAGKGAVKIVCLPKSTNDLWAPVDDGEDVWRYCSSNLTLFHAQISFLSAPQNMCFKKIA